MARELSWLGSVRPSLRLRPGAGIFIMGAVILVLAGYLIYPVILLLILSFNTAPDILVGPAHWGLSNWVYA